MLWAKLSPALAALLAAGWMLAATARAANADDTGRWQVGTPIATYWLGPPMTDATAKQMADGGFNLVWCSPDELDAAQRHGLRGMLQSDLLAPEALDDPAKLQGLNALIDRAKSHPALYAYYVTDEPNASRFAALGRLVAYLRERDPAHLAYINLFPTCSSEPRVTSRQPTPSTCGSMSMSSSLTSSATTTTTSHQTAIAGSTS